jgi:hypothetical protein
MKRLILLGTFMVFLSEAFSQTNTFPSSGNVGIGTTTPVTLLDVKSGIDIDGTSTGFIAPYQIGGTNDVGAGQPLQYILLTPLVTTSTGSPSAGLSGILAMYRGNGGSYNVSAEYRIVIQAAYSSTNIAITPLSETSPLLNIYDVTYNGQQYVALKTIEVAFATYRVTFRGHWWNNINGMKPEIVSASSLSTVSIYKDYASALGGNIYVNTSGNVLIGKTSQTNTSYKLDVNGNIRANQVTVNATGADYVFDSDYSLPPLANVETYIEQNHHLPDIPSVKDMQANGINLGTNQTRLLQKIEELTLYIIAEDKKNQQLQSEVDLLKKEFEVYKSKTK